MSEQRDALMVLMLGAVAYVLVRTFGGVSDTVTDTVENPGQSVGDAFVWGTSQYKDAVTTTADHAAGSVDESVARQFDDTKGGGFGDMYFQQVEDTYNAMTPDTSTVEDTWNATTPDVGHVGDAYNDVAGATESTWNKYTPDVGSLW